MITLTDQDCLWRRVRRWDYCSALRSGPDLKIRKAYENPNEKPFCNATKHKNSISSSKAPETLWERSHAGQYPVSYAGSWTGGRRDSLMAPGRSGNDCSAESLQRRKYGRDWTDLWDLCYGGSYEAARCILNVFGGDGKVRYYLLCLLLRSMSCCVMWVKREARWWALVGQGCGSGIWSGSWMETETVYVAVNMLNKIMKSSVKV